MVLGLNVLNSDSTINSYRLLGSAQIIRGADATIRLQLTQPEKENIRYMPASGATFEITLLNSDGTTLVKTPTQPFSGTPSDSSILELTLTAAETATLISQNLNVKVTEGAVVSYAVLQAGFQVVTLNSDC